MNVWGNYGLFQFRHLCRRLVVLSARNVISSFMRLSGPCWSFCGSAGCQPGCAVSCFYFLQAGAAEKGVPLYKHIADLAGNTKLVGCSVNAFAWTNSICGGQFLSQFCLCVQLLDVVSKACVGGGAECKARRRFCLVRSMSCCSRGFLSTLEARQRSQRSPFSSRVLVL